MPTTYTGNSANVTPTATPSGTLPSDGDPENVSSVNSPLSKLFDFMANVFNSILNGFSAPLRLLGATSTALQSTTVWNAITPSANWAAFGNPAYMKDATGRVWLRGGLQNNTGASSSSVLPLGTLPAGFRPAFNRVFTTNDGNSTQYVLTVFSNGSALVSATTPIASAAFIYLDGISFIAEQ